MGKGRVYAGSLSSCVLSSALPTLGDKGLVASPRTQVAQSTDLAQAEKAPGNRNCVTSVITAPDACTLVVGWKGVESPLD